MRYVCVLTLVWVLGWTAPSCFGWGGSGVEMPELTPFDEDLAARLYAIAASASEVRGLEGDDEIEQGTLSPDQLAEYYRRAAAEARLQGDTNYEALNTAFRLLHMIGTDDDLLELGEASAADVLGFYAYEADQLVLISDIPGEFSLEDEATLAHEFVHSFQDKQFDLGKLVGRTEKEEREKANTEYADTLVALIEGDAMLAQFQYVERKAGPGGLRNWLALSGDEGDGEESGDTALPPAIQRYMGFPYLYGSAFVSYLYEEGGWEAVNEAYEDPPKTEEQLLHPDKYARGEDAAALSLRNLSNDLGKGWEQEMDSVFGEFDVYNWLRSTLADEFRAQSAASGWGGGRVAVYANPEEQDSVLVHIALTWDDVHEARGFFTAFQDVVRLIDPESIPLDESGQILAWQGDGEMGQAWIDRLSFQMVVGVAQEDLETVLAAIDAPTTIPESGHILQQR